MVEPFSCEKKNVFILCMKKEVVWSEMFLGFFSKLGDILEILLNVKTSNTKIKACAGLHENAHLLLKW